MKYIWPNIPESLVEQALEILDNLPEQLTLSTHGADEILTDPLGIVPFPNKNQLIDERTELLSLTIDFDFSLEIKRITKLNLKVTWINTQLDYVYVITPKGLLITAWATLKKPQTEL